MTWYSGKDMGKMACVGFVWVGFEGGETYVEMQNENEGSCLRVVKMQRKEGFMMYLE